MTGQSTEELRKVEFMKKVANYEKDLKKLNKALLNIAERYENGKATIEDFVEFYNKNPLVHQRFISNLSMSVPMSDKSFYSIANTIYEEIGDKVVFRNNGYCYDTQGTTLKHSGHVKDNVLLRSNLNFPGRHYEAFKGFCEYVSQHREGLKSDIPSPDPRNVEHLPAGRGGNEYGGHNYE